MYLSTKTTKKDTYVPKTNPDQGSYGLTTWSGLVRFHSARAPSGSTDFTCSKMRRVLRLEGNHPQGHSHRWPFGKVDGPGKWNKTQQDQCYVCLAQLT